MNPELVAALLNFAIRFGIDAAIAIAERINRPSATIDDALAGLKDARTKSAEDYLREAQNELTPIS